MVNKYKCHIINFISFLGEFRVNKDSIDSRIVGGQKAALGQFPFACNLRSYDAANNVRGAFFCSCSLIKPNTVLTAAHCIEGADYTQTIVQSGTNKNDNTTGVFTRVRSIIIHKDYDSAKITNDVAVLKLESELTFDSNTNKIDPCFEVSQPNTQVTLATW